MNDRAVVTLCIGDKVSSSAEITHPVLKAYADKIGADFVVIDKKKISKKFVHYEKFQIYDLLLKYKRIIYLDSDIVIRPDCPDLFEIVPEHKIGIFNEGAYMDMLEVIRDACRKFKMSINKWERQSYNTGVMVFSRLHRSIFEKPEEEFDVYESGNQGVYHYEQPYLNLKIITSEFQVQELSYKFNCMSIMDKLTGESRLSSYIIHYAGQTHLGVITESVMKSDLEAWSKSKEFKYQRNIHVRVGGGLGDQICAEPVIRYMCNVMYKGDNIKVESDFPDVFKHLIPKVKLKKVGERDSDNTIYFEMQTMPSPKEPLWNYIAHTLCHSVDFSSISALRRTLPDCDKQIYQAVDDDSLKSIEKILASIDLKQLVLVHPGRGWPSKTFPNKYWQSIIDSLVEEKFQVAVIGKYVSNEQGLVDIKCPVGCHDLRNLLTYKELVALISQAQILISNDSAPVHIAGAFDNWIVLLPSCKHPDHVLPYRNCTKMYKTKVLYKRLTCDAIDSSPTQVEGQTIDYVVGDINDYLTEVSDITNAVKSL